MINIHNNEIKNSNEDRENYNQREKNYESPKISALKGEINLTNFQINNTRYYHNETIPIEGKIYDFPAVGVPDLNVSILMDGILYPQFNDTTDLIGEFKINLTVPFETNIYVEHKIEVEITDDIGFDFYAKINHYMLNFNATSYFDIDNYNLNNPQLAGGYYNIPGYLKYDNHTGLSSQTINNIWYNETIKTFIPPNAPFNTTSDGSFKYIPIPDDNISKIMFLNLTFSSKIPYINGSEKMISVQIYRNITCVWSTAGSATQGKTIAISGQLFARNYSNIVINFTDVRLMFQGGASIGNTTTDANGFFSYNYQIPSGISGLNEITVDIVNFTTVYSNATHFISISLATITPAESIGDDDEETPPFQNFLIIFIPIIIGIGVALSVFIYFFLKRQKEESLTVKLPLEDRIINLKILKDTGRLEEALSYLFQSIYMELINAKFGVIKKENETIRDFAIISVKDLNLSPSNIYPFIQNIERIIYDKPFIIKEQDFYSSVELFSPIYYELTGYHFVLNF